MSCDWPLVRLSDHASFQEGYVNPTQKKPEYFDGEVKWLRAVDLNDGFVYETSRTLSLAGFESAGKSAKLFEPGTIAISKSGTIGRVGILKDYMCGNRAVINVKPDEQTLDTRFAFYTLKYRRPDIELLATGSVQPNLYTSALGSLEFRLPPLTTQKSISALLSSLDEKVDCNTQTNQTLEQMAQALFKSWFVDFDPVIDNALAAGNPIPDELAERAAQRQALFAQDNAPARLPEATRALFPDRFEQHPDLGWIPVGWEASRLDEVMELAYGKALKKTDRIEGTVPVYGSGGVGGYHNEHLVKGPGIIVGRKGTVGSLYWEDDDFFPIDTVFYVKPKEEIPLGYCFELLKTLGLEHMNTDAAVPGLNRNNAYRLLFAKPNSDIKSIFAETLGAIKDKQKVLHDESKSLGTLRDTLLPKLLSGELTLPEAETAMEAIE